MRYFAEHPELFDDPSFDPSEHFAERVDWLRDQVKDTPNEKETTHEA